MQAVVGALLGLALALAGTAVSVRWTEQRRARWEWVVWGAVGAVTGWLLMVEYGVASAFFHLWLLSGVLITASVVDLHERIIPNELMLAAALAGVALHLVAPRTLWTGPLVGALVGLGLLLVIALLYRDGMGMGDVKLAGVVGLYLGGVAPTLLFLFLSFVSGALVSIVLMLTRRVGRKDHIPFGPFLALGAVVTAIWGDAILRWYLGA